MPSQPIKKSPPHSTQISVLSANFSYAVAATCVVLVEVLHPIWLRPAPSHARCVQTWEDHTCHSHCAWHGISGSL